MNISYPAVAGGGLYILRLSDTHYYGGRAQDFTVRWKTHLADLLRGNHCNKHMQAVFNRYGRYEPEVLNLLSESFREAEQKWLDENFRQPGCVNLSPYADGGNIVVWDEAARKKLAKAQTGKIRSDESRQKQSTTMRARPDLLNKARESLQKNRLHISAEKMRERGLALAATNRGRKHTPEHIEKTRRVHIGRRNTPETLLQMSESARARSVTQPTSHGPSTRALISQQQRGRFRVHKEGVERSVFPEEARILLDQGWEQGPKPPLAGFKGRMKNEVSPKGSPLPNTQGLVWVHSPDPASGVGDRRILEEDLDFFLNELGWKLGQSFFEKDVVWIRRKVGEELEYRRVPRQELAAWLAPNEGGWETGFQTHTPEHHERASQSWTPEMREAARQRVLSSPPPQPDSEARRQAGLKQSEQMRGRTLSEEHRKKLSEAQKQRWARSGGGHTEEAKASMREKALARHAEHPELWATSDEKRRKVSESGKGRVWVNNGSKNRFLPPQEAEALRVSDAGWTLGRK